MNKEVLIIGAGKIGRGFIAHLFYLSGYRIWLLDNSKETVELLNAEKKYRVDVAGENHDLTEYVNIEGAFTLEDKDQVVHIISRIEIMASSVGAGNIRNLAIYMKDIFTAAARMEPVNWLICENASHPARLIKEILLQDAGPGLKSFVTSSLGLIETQVLRTGMPAREEVISREPLALRMQNWWTLPLDKDAFIGPVPDIKGFRPQANFSNELTRKLYTNNGTNAAIAYVGWANGHTILHESALAFPAYFKEIMEESAYGLINEFGFDKEQHRAFMDQAMKKYTDPALNDLIVRNAHDSKRKLAREERLIGPAMLCLKYGRMPLAFAKAIAAAYSYKGSVDEGTKEVQDTIKESGIEAAVKKFSSLDESSALFELVVDSYNLKSFLFKTG